MFSGKSTWGIETAEYNRYNVIKKNNHNTVESVNVVRDSYSSTRARVKHNTYTRTHMNVHALSVGWAC